MSPDRMSLIFKEYITASGETLLYTGPADLTKLEQLASGPGDMWHSSFEQGFKNLFPELVYQTAVFFIYINDFDGLDECVSWRINPDAFAIRKKVWEQLGGFDTAYDSAITSALHFGYNALRFRGAVPMYIKGLFDAPRQHPQISVRDRYVFFRKNFKSEHSLFMLYREGFLPREWRQFLYARKNFRKDPPHTIVPPRPLAAVTGRPTVSYIIPTMYRQDYTLRLLDDLTKQTFPPTQVVIVDATPEHARDGSDYMAHDFPFEVTVIWQTSKGSCRARNEALEKCTGDYIVFGDDDIRIPSNFIENHVRLLQTYGAGACNGLDIRADHHEQDLSDLAVKLEQMGDRRWIVGPAQTFSNANSCVHRDFIEKLGGNDINFDGGYGEDMDFGISLLKAGAVVLHNPFSANLHLKPPSGGFRFWGAQARIIGKKRKKQPWELDTPVGWVRPVPSPTIMYQIVKQFTPQQLTEYKHKYFFLFLFKGPAWSLPYRLLRIPYKLVQFSRSVFYARKLNALGVRIK